MINVNFIGIVLNPKTLEPCVVFKTRRRTVEIWNSNFNYEGKGYFDAGDSGDEYSASEQSGYPRVHTPDGVKTKKRGYGTVLYTGLCLAAHLEDKNKLTLEGLQTSGDGISSNEKRSRAAELWWKQAKELGLAHEVDVEGEDSTEPFDGELNSDESATRGKIRELVSAAIETYLDRHGEGGEQVESWTLCFYGTRTLSGAPATADVYEYEEARRFVVLETNFETEGQDRSDDKHQSEVDALYDLDIEDIVREDYFELNEAVFSTMDLSGAHPDLVLFLSNIVDVLIKVRGSRHMKRTWERVLAFGRLGIKLADEHVDEAGEEVEEMYSGLRPQMNPADLTPAEVEIVRERGKAIKKLGLDRFLDLDE